MLAYDTEREAAELRDVCKGVDAVVSVACLGGTRAVKLLVPAEVRVVSAMKTVGVFQICKELDETRGLVYANQQRSRVWRFVRECSLEEAQMDGRPS